MNPRAIAGAEPGLSLHHAASDADELETSLPPPEPLDAGMFKDLTKACPGCVEVGYCRRETAPSVCSGLQAGCAG